MGVVLAAAFGMIGAKIAGQGGWGWLHWAIPNLCFWLGGHTEPKIRRWWRTRKALDARQVDNEADESGGLGDGVGEVEWAEG